MVNRDRLLRLLRMGIILLVCGVAGFAIWASFPPQVEGQALISMNAADESRLREGTAISFLPDGISKEVGFVFYPGGRVRPEAYAPLAEKLALEGFLIVIPRMTLNLAVFELNAANEIINAHPEISIWIIGGHSLGGAMAASYAWEHLDQISGLVLYASYPSDGTDLSSSNMPVLSISANRDGLATEEDILAGRSRLPFDTEWVLIDGGNHAGFGWYGDQRGDHPALISKENQQQIIINTTLLFLESFNKNGS